MAKILLNEKLKEEIKKWRQKEYEGVSTITKRLLNFWFNEEHFIKDERFEFWRCQREAIEALIYLYEVCKYHSLYEIFKNLNIKGIQFDPTQDIWAKYCFKMATGSGKTFVMAMAIVWQYFNKLHGTKNGLRYSNHFLLIAPNLIVLDRLYGDETSACFKDNQIFKDFPFIPEEWVSDFDFQVIFQSQITPQHSKGVLYLTNIQQMYNKKRSEIKNPIKNALGSEPPTEEEIIYNTLLADLAKYDDLLILNDEAHHVHSDYIEWYKVIENLDTSIKNSYGNGIIMQLDFSATPYVNPNVKVPFPHVIYDYPLGEAIKDKIVKAPKIGEIENAPEPISKKFVKKNRLQIDTGIEIFKKFKKDLKNIGKKPVLFIMCDNTTHASEVGEYLEQDKGYKNKVLVIHTDREGDVTIKDLDLARSVAKNIDKNQYEIIVSVMMLKEGWDVKNVVAIVPLRAYDSQILVEQTLGRGLRRMTPIEEGWDEKLIVIEHPRFSALWQTEIKEGELNIQITKAKKVYEPTNLISVMLPKVKKFDVEIPVVEGGLTKALPDLNKLDLNKFPHKVFKWSDIKIDDPRLIIKDLMTQKIEHKRELKFDYTEITEEYLSFMTKAILAKSGSSMQFPELVPIVKKYIESFFFDKKINIDNKENVKKLNWYPIREKIRDIFVDALNKLAKKEEKYKITKYYKVSETKPFHTSEPIYETKKTVFNAISYSKKSNYEKLFMIYLDKQEEVLAYTKVLPRFPLKIPYYENNNLRHYIPDFIVKTKDIIYLIETKGAGFEEMQTAKLKEEFAKRWVEEISSLLKKKWVHVKIVDSDFNKYYNLPFNRLIKAISK